LTLCAIIKIDRMSGGAEGVRASRRPVAVASSILVAAAISFSFALMPRTSAVLAADAAVITVTNDRDDEAGDTTSIAKLLAAPGPNGISLRSAMIAANNTPGPKAIRFAPALQGRAIQIGIRLPALTGGSLTIDGDTSGGGQPEITLDGSSGADKGMVISSNGNTVTHVRFSGFPDNAIQFGCPGAVCPPRTTSGNRILANTFVSNAANIVVISVTKGDPVAQAQLSGFAWEDTEISDNTFIVGAQARFFGGVIVLRPGAGGSHGNRVSRTKILRNRITGSRVAINIHVGDETSHERSSIGPEVFSDDNLVEDTLIAENVVTGAGALNQAIVAQVADTGNRNNRLLRTTIARNAVTGAMQGIMVLNGEQTDFGNDQDRSTSANVVSDLQILGNRVSGGGIHVFAAGNFSAGRLAPVSTNRIEKVVIRDNVISGVDGPALQVCAGATDGPEILSDNVIDGLTISNNQVTAPQHVEYWQGLGRTTGIEVVGGCSASGGSVRGNRILDVTFAGNSASVPYPRIAVIGGRGSGATANSVLVTTVTDNTIDQAVADVEGASADSVIAPLPPIEQRIADFWKRIDALQPTDHVSTADLGLWAQLVIERNARARLGVTDFRAVTAGMQAAIERAGNAPTAGAPTATDIEQRIADFWKRIDALEPSAYVSTADLGLWAQLVIGRNTRARLTVGDFRDATAAMQAAIDRTGDGPLGP
jgi:hypothetical protein